MNFNRPWSGLRANDLNDNYTDLISNSVILDELDLFSETESLFHQLSTPEYLRPFLHEKTHHTCLNSPVGLAISALYSSSSSMPLEKIQGETGEFGVVGETTIPIRDLIVLYFTYHLFEPLIEGLAVFAEHDSVQGDSPVLSQVVISTTQILMAEPDFVTKNLFVDGKLFPPYVATDVFIRANRATNEWIEQKAFLLEQNITDRPFYLLGYLAVKGIYRSLVGKCPKLYDPELFLLLMMDYWFHDFTLAEILLNLSGSKISDLEVEATLYEISEYFQDKLDELYRNVERYAEECESYHSADTEELIRNRKEPSYRNSSIDMENFKYLHAMRIASVSINVFQPKIFQFRREFRFSSQLGEISIDDESKRENKAILKLDKNSKTLKIPIVPNADIGNYKVSIEGVQHGETGEVFIIITGGTGLVALKNIKTNEWNNPQMVEYFDFFPSIHFVKQMMEKFALNHSFLEDSKYKVFFDSAISQTQEAVNFLYPQLAFRISKDDAKKIIESLSKDGFKGIISDEELDKVAEWSLLCGARSWDVREFSRLENINENLILDEVQEINAKIKEKIGIDSFFIIREVGQVISCI